MKIVNVENTHTYYTVYHATLLDPVSLQVPIAENAGQTRKLIRLCTLYCTTDMILPAVSVTLPKRQ